MPFGSRTRNGHAHRCAWASVCDILNAMSTNVKIEVDERTADVLEGRAAELGMTVSELVAELATLDSDPVVVDSDEVAELDRRWKKIEAGAPTIPHERVVR